MILVLLITPEHLWLSSMRGSVERKWNLTNEFIGMATAVNRRLFAGS